MPEFSLAPSDVPRDPSEGSSAAASYIKVDTLFKYPGAASSDAYPAVCRKIQQEHVCDPGRRLSHFAREAI